MNRDKVVLDTNAVLYLLNGDTSFLAFIQGKDIIVSIITEIELLSSKNLNESTIKAIQKFLDKCLIIDIMPAVKENSIFLRKKYNLKLPDTIIAATAFTFDIPFITADKKLFTIEDVEIVKISIQKK